jgi:hypothetical protein
LSISPRAPSSSSRWRRLPKSQHLIDTYARGVDMKLARTTPVPSHSAQWRGAPPVVRPQPPSTRRRTSNIGRFCAGCGLCAGQTVASTPAVVDGFRSLSKRRAKGRFAVVFFQQRRGL